MMMMSDKSYSNRIVLTIIPVLLAIALLVTGCSTKSVYQRKGSEFNRSGQYDKAVEYFELALKENSKVPELRTMLFRSKLNKYYYHLALARKWKASGKKEDAVKEYRIALAVFPNNQKVADELDTFLNGGKKKEEPGFVSSIEPPVKLAVDTSEKITLNLRSTPITKIFKMVGKSYNVNFVFDKDFRDFVYSIETENIGFYDIINQLCLVANVKYRVVDTTSLLIYPNTTFKERTFGLKGVKVFFLSSTRAEDVKKLVTNVFRDSRPSVQEDANLNCLIVTSTKNTLREIERFIHIVDKKKSEVKIDVEIIEMNRNLLRSIGADYGETLSNVSAGAPTSSGDSGSSSGVNNLMEMENLGKTVFFINIPSAAIHLLETDENTRIISRPNLRSVDGEEVKFMVGDEIPIPQTQFQAGAAGGVSNIPVTSYQYKSVGVDVKITPTIHRDNDVTLKIKLEIDFITGYLGIFPTLGKRELEAVIRLKEGESNIVGGFIKDEVRGSTAGIPALSKLPILGKLFGRSSGGIDQKDLIFSITPRVIRHVDVKADDVAPIGPITLPDSRVPPVTMGPRREYAARRPGPVDYGPAVHGRGRTTTPPRDEMQILLSPTKRKNYPLVLQLPISRSA